MPDPGRPDRNAPPCMPDYATARADYVVRAPERFNPVIDIVDAWARVEPDALALVSLDAAGQQQEAHTISELGAMAQRAASALQSRGVGKGDRVLVMLPRVSAWYAAMLGAMRLGAVAIPTPNLSTARDIAYRLRVSGAVGVIGDAGAVEKVAETGEDVKNVRLRLRLSPDGTSVDGWEDFDRAVSAASTLDLPMDPTAAGDPLVVFFTSGTVSYPKMVLHPQSYALGHVATARFWHDLRPGDRHWTVSDTGWAKAAWGGLFGQWHERACVVQMALGRPHPDRMLETLARNGITSFCAPPTVYRLLVQADLSAHDLSALRHCTSAGEPLNPEIIRAWAEGTGGLTIFDGYGQSESTVLVANYRALPVRPGSMGKPVPGYDIGVVDDEGQPVAAGTVANVAVRTEPHPVGLFSEYLGDTAATSEAFRNGWYFTGDKALLDEDGYFWFEGRADDVITSSAYRIGPFEVESALVEHPAVVEAAVVGRDDPQRTQIVCAFVILAQGAVGTDDLISELQDHVKQVTAPYKYPREIRFVDELPKTISGKIRRSELRRQINEVT